MRQEQVSTQVMPAASGSPGLYTTRRLPVVVAASALTGGMQADFAPVPACRSIDGAGRIPPAPRE